LSTICKALKLLDIFTPSQPELGLSEIARIIKSDKATVHRMLRNLAESGFLEQNSETRLYRLGVKILHLAKNREASFPFDNKIQAALINLTNLTKETSHVSIMSGHNLTAYGFIPSPHSMHVTFEEGQIFDFHCTASGLSILAFSETTFVDDILSKKLVAYTSNTEIKPDKIKAQLKKFKQTGYAISDQMYEEGVYGIATPLFANQTILGALAVATPKQRINKESIKIIISALIKVAIKTTYELGSSPPEEYLCSVKDYR
jgi:DNA-binding IclR family transcriptional regulator